MTFKIGDRVKCIRPNDAFWYNDGWSNTNDYSDGSRIGIICAIDGNKITLGSCEYNSDCFILADEVIKKNIKVYNIVNFCKENYK